MTLDRTDLTTRISRVEAGMIITKLRQKGDKIMYRELEGFSPEDAAKTTTARRLKLTAKKIAELAGRVEPVTEPPEVE